MPSRLLALGLAVAAAALQVDLFLPWARYAEFLSDSTGWNSGPGFVCGLATVILIAWEGARAAGVWSGWPRDTFAGFLLAAAAGICGIGDLVLIRWGGFSTQDPRLAYGAWLGLALSLVLLVAAALRLVEHRRLFVAAVAR